ncbi:MAG: diguanylate cyclase [Eubacterium sp.]
MNNQKKKNESWVINLIVTVGIAIVLMIGLNYYVKNVEKNVEEETGQYLGEIASESAQLVKQKLDSGIDILNSMANMIGISEANLEDPETLMALEKKINQTDFQNIGIQTKEGKTYSTETQKEYDVSDMAYFQKGLKGAPSIEIVMTKDTQKQAAVISVPIYRGNEIIGVLVGRYYTKDLIKLLNVTSFGGEGYSYLAEGNGTIFAIADHPSADKEMVNVIDVFKDSEFKDPFALQKMQVDMREGKSGNITYKWKETYRVMNYAPIGINDWYLLSVVPETVIENKSDYFLTQSAILFSILIVAFSVLSSYIYVSQKKKRRELKAANLEIAESQRRYEMILGQYQEIIFEWNVHEKTIFYTKYFKEKFGFDPKTENFPECNLEEHSIFKDDEPIFLALFEEVAQKECSIERELRIMNSSGYPVWCRVRVMSLSDDTGKVYKVLGIISDIDDEKREYERLEEAASRDFLTKLYNKGAIENSIKEWLKNGDEKRLAAFFVIDIDDFKGINDNFGHIYGDKVLREIADCISSAMRVTDNVGRIGGDEFVIFMKDVKDEKACIRKADELVRSFEQCVISKDFETPYKISGSIGIAIYPSDGLSYEELFKKADIALYYAKEHGKNQYMIYRDEVL